MCVIGACMHHTNYLWVGFHYPPWLGPEDNLECVHHTNRVHHHRVTARVRGKVWLLIFNLGLVNSRVAPVDQTQVENQAKLCLQVTVGENHMRHRCLHASHKLFMGWVPLSSLVRPRRQVRVRVPHKPHASSSCNRTSARQSLAVNFKLGFGQLVLRAS